MRAVDTNILARFLLRDDQRQAAAAADILREPFWVTATVWVELGWVLCRQLKLERARVADAIGTLLLLETLNTADRDGVCWATERFRQGADWADMMHIVTARGIGDSFATLDKSPNRHAGRDAAIPVETLR